MKIASELSDFVGMEFKYTSNSCSQNAIQKTAVKFGFDRKSIKNGFSSYQIFQKVS